ncbi:MAG: PspA/IM30 family protein [Catalinimonas sp.]
MGVFKRLFKISEAETHAAIDRLEDPIRMTEQGIRDMKSELDKALHGLAEIKALAIRARGEKQRSLDRAADYEQKAVALLQRAESGQLDAAEADRLATEALAQQQQQKAHVERTDREEQQFNQSVAQMEGNVRKLRADISKWENELKTLKARANVSSATRKINQQLAQVDSSGTVSMLERMKDKVNKEEALAEAYGDIALESRSVDEEIDQALDDPAKSSGDALAALKAKMRAEKETA